MRHRLLGLFWASLLLGLAGLVGVADAAPPPRSPRGDACGDPVIKADGTAWACTFVDDFGGNRLDRRAWLPQVGLATGTPSGRACFADDPSTVSVRGGSLRLSVVPAPAPVECQGSPAGFLSGSVSTYHRFSQQYGRFEARMKVTETAAPGLQEAFWLWPDDRYPSATVWPAAGEIDIAETYSYYPSLAIPYLHYTAWDNWGPQPGVNTAWDCLAPRGEWHTYTLSWTSTRLRIEVDGRHCLTNDSDDPAFDKPYIVALTQALGVDANAWDGSGPMPATTEVDYVKVWR